MEISSWKKCSSCKKDIPFKTKYWVCNVSTCNGQRTGYVFCSIPCFERHLPGARHKDAYAVEETSPSSATISTTSPGSTSASSTPSRRIIPEIQKSPLNKSQNETNISSSLNQEVLVVVSKLKEYIDAMSGMNTSDTCKQILSDWIRRECLRAIENARKEGRKTVMDRDFQLR